MFMNSSEHDQLILYISKSMAGGCSLMDQKKKRVTWHVWNRICPCDSPFSLFISPVPHKSGAGALNCSKTRKAQQSCTLFALSLSLCIPSSHADSESPCWQAKKKVVCDISTDPDHHCCHPIRPCSLSPVAPLLTSLPLFTSCLSKLLLC